MTFVRTTLFLFASSLAAFAFACGGAPDDAASAASAEAASTSASPATIHGRAVKKLGPVFGRPVQGIATAALAHATEKSVRDDAAEQASEQCAATLALPIGSVHTRLVGLASSVTEDASDGRFVVTAETQQTYCAPASLDDAALVTFDGALHASPDGPIRAGAAMLLDPGLDRVADDVSVLGKSVATRAHLLARFDGGAFHEVTGLAGVDAKKGGTVDVELPFPDDALLVDVASAADRFEMYFRVERWTVTGSFEDGNFDGTLVAPLPDTFVSDFGANYRLPVAR